MKWEILKLQDLYRGFFHLRHLRLSHGRFEGGEPMVVDRELLDRGHAAGVLPYDPVRDEVLLVEQFRVGAIESPHGPWLMEIIAGLIDAGERAESVARREALEEAGCHLDELVHVHDYYATPGSSTERISLFVARADLSGAGGIHGLAHEGEEIRVHVLPAEEAFDQLDRMQVDTAMTIIALQWLRLNREGLRERWGG
ncbi:NUDIX domain-containing protein [Ectothiorhodospira lacustris]|uniref:NUDIX domain-containing protein n=1 Tax=Ectothiorhodospira lacustris TaxID=2899127 RepID=UPI001EE8D4D5|nr:NUDIX domain-containing protein [Ectothiorhodospira lacustris]MCG5499980.1 NUDIX domain-containing protein [Ectothiorhodospira lacustris]MCG5510950.1 NUDIX domain-containing protein [Ectothiorhodospira lacustris]MCG5522682.1 NUDIX domain-containing protein [Ectothiorhodospira lacustris]